MKNSTVIALGIAAVAAFGIDAYGAGPDVCEISGKKMLSFMQRSFGKMKQTASAQQRTPGMARISETAKKIKPGTTRTYGWWRDNWVADDTYTYTYDAAGNVTVEDCKDAEGDYSRTVNEYNENGMVVFKEVTVSSDGVNYTNNRKTEFEYDPILTDVITKRTEWMWMGGDWKLVGNNYQRTINRDEAGNITSVVISVLFDGVYDPTQRMTITYGENGEAVEMSEEILDYDGKEYFWEQGMKATDITWDRTNGQIWSTELDDILSGANRIKSAHIIEPGDDGIEADITLDYADDSDAYTAKLSMTMEGMPVSGKMTYTPLENGGGRFESKILFLGMELFSTTEEERYDDWGLMTLQSVEERDYEGSSIYECLVGEVEYDSEGRPATYTVTQYYEDDDLEEPEEMPMMKAEFSDYMDVTAGVEAIEGASGTVERCFDLQGRPVAHPEKGQIVVKDKRLEIKY